MRDRDDFDPVRTARTLISEARSAALATLRPDGAPYASLVTVAPAPDGAPILLLSRLARHTVNLASDSRVSLLVQGVANGDPLQGARVSIAGSAATIGEPAVRRRFLARHPEAASYASFADFAFWRIEPAGAHLVAGFGRIVDLPREHVLIDVGEAAELLMGEESALAHMNEDHADAIERYATRLLGERPGRWRMIGIDPAGCDLMLEGRVRRLFFSHRITTLAALRAILSDLAGTTPAGRQG